MTVKFSIGYNYDLRMLGLLTEYQRHLEALYLPIPQRYLSSGRSLREPQKYERQIPRIIKQCRSLDITPQLLLNPTMESPAGLSETFIRRLMAYLKQLCEHGLQSVVVVNPVYMERIHNALPALRIESSVNCFVRTVEHALYLKKIGVDVITVDRDINRNMQMIEAIKAATGLKIRIMLNEGCLANCPYRIVHYNYLALQNSGKKKKIAYRNPDTFCVNIYRDAPERIFRIPFIPPEETGHYADIADYFKLSTRAFDTGRIERCLQMYIRRRGPDNLLDMLDCPGLAFFSFVDYRAMHKADYFRKMSRCTLDCATCSYCKVLFRKAVLEMPVKGIQPNTPAAAKALRFFKRRLAAQDNASRQSFNALRIGQIYLSRGKYAAALPFLKRAYSGGRGSSMSRFLLGKCLMQLGFYRRALAYLEKLPWRHQDNFEVAILLVRCYKNTKKKKQFNRMVKQIARYAHKEGSFIAPISS